ncbi:MAG: SPFH domain-containing protein, partial [Clostridia bacterium]|nr:SPFH domain-containing protein [Clostridia bacterium]
MTEKTLKGRKIGMAVLLLTILILLASLAGMIYGAVLMEKNDSEVPNALFIISTVVLCIGWLPLIGLRVLKPQEALVVTLFGKYVGTLKGDGFYWVNPFSSSVNPAARTKLNQSGDVMQVKAAPNTNGAQTAEIPSKKLSLKIMTLNNAKQKINDCLGNPVEIGIAVTWRIVDTAKAV